jgi:hypothetical protein
VIKRNLIQITDLLEWLQSTVEKYWQIVAN